ncbi:MAG TPA: ABC transporter substrate-binding protein [Acidimicrobiales bacterium]|nr:ABC transporter substrate-binding protein [Acidimicrobiales bacterium]
MTTPTRPRPLRALLVLLALLGLLAACGDDDTGAETGGEPASATRTVEGAYGPIEIPSDPQRIFADIVTVDYLTALGFDTTRIVGVFDAEHFAEEDGYLGDFFNGQELADPGFQYEMNVEAVAAAEPDLILVPFDQIDGAPQQAELGDIAPLLVVPTSTGEDPAGRYGGSASFQDWRGTIRAYGELLGLEEEAEAHIAETEGLMDDVREQHGELIARITVNQAKTTSDYVAINALDIPGGSLSSLLLTELGFRAPDAVAGLTPDEYGSIDISAENTHLMDADLLFLEVREGSTRHEESPLWAGLGVVRAGDVVVVGNHWEFGGAVAARQVVRDIDAALDDYATEQKG